MEVHNIYNDVIVRGQVLEMLAHLKKSFNYMGGIDLKMLLVEKAREGLVPLLLALGNPSNLGNLSNMISS